MIELSTGHVYAPNRVPRKESDKCKPGTKQAKWKLQAEEDLAKVQGLNCVVLRLANVYGPYASGAGLSTALCMARVYQSEGREMKWLWDRELRCNTVHVEDVVSAMWSAAEWYVRKMGTHIEMREVGGNGEEDGDAGTVTAGLTAVTLTSGEREGEAPPAQGAGAQSQPTGLPPSQPPQNNPPPLRPLPTFNIVDHTSTSQAHLSSLISSYFTLPSTFASTLTSAFARVNLDRVVTAANDDLLDPWAELLQNANITRPGPISPFMEREMLGDRELSMDGSKFEREVGFVYQREKLGEREVAEVVDSWARMGWWP